MTHYNYYLLQVLAITYLITTTTYYNYSLYIYVYIHIYIYMHIILTPSRQVKLPRLGILEFQNQHDYHHYY